MEKLNFTKYRQPLPPNEPLFTLTAVRVEDDPQKLSAVQLLEERERPLVADFTLVEWGQNDGEWIGVNHQVSIVVPTACDEPATVIDMDTVIPIAWNYCSAWAVVSATLTDNEASVTFRNGCIMRVGDEMYLVPQE